MTTKITTIDGLAFRTHKGRVYFQINALAPISCVTAEDYERALRYRAALAEVTADWEDQAADPELWVDWLWSRSRPATQAELKEIPHV